MPWRVAVKLADWRKALAQNVESGRQVLRLLLAGRLRFTPVADRRRRGYAFTGTLALDRVVEGVVELPPVNQIASKSPIGGGEHVLARRPNFPAAARARVEGAVAEAELAFTPGDALTTCCGSTRSS